MFDPEKPISLLPPAWVYRIKAATRDLIAASGGIDRASGICGYSRAAVGRWHNTSDPDVISIRAALALEAECNLPLVTGAMADLHGRQLSDAGLGNGSSPSMVFHRHADAMGAAAEMMSAFAVASSDNVITPAEAEDVDRKASTVERAIGALRLALAGVKARVSGREGGR